MGLNPRSHIAMVTTHSQGGVDHQSQCPEIATLLVGCLCEDCKRAKKTRGYANGLSYHCVKTVPLSEELGVLKLTDVSSAS